MEIVIEGFRHVIHYTFHLLVPFVFGKLLMSTVDTFPFCDSMTGRPVPRMGDREAS